MVKYFLKDLISDILGGSGVYLSITSIMEGTTNFIKLLAAIGGLVLVYYSIKYKIELLKEKKRENQLKENFRKK